MRAREETGGGDMCEPNVPWYSDLHPLLVYPAAGGRGEDTVRYRVCRIQDTVRYRVRRIQDTIRYRVCRIQLPLESERGSD